TGPVTFTFTFSEAVSGFTADDVAVTNGSKGTFTSVDGQTYTLVVTPTDNTTGNISVSVPAGAATDSAGNPSIASQVQQIIDTVAPSVVISTTDSNLSIGEVTTLTFTFSESVTGFTASDIAPSGGTISNLVQSAENPTVWTATFTSTGGGSPSVSLPAGSYTDLAGNAGSAGSLNLNSDPIAINDNYLISGLVGQYFGYNDTATGAGNNGANLTNLAQVETFIDGRAPTATFTATNLNYGPIGDGGLGNGSKLQTFLGGDALSLSPVSANSSDAIIKLNGLVNLAAGNYQFLVTADDGFSIRINGQTIAQFNGNQGPTPREFDFTVPVGGAQQFEIVYWDQAGNAQLTIELRPQGGTYSVLGGSSLQHENPALVTDEDQALTISPTTLLGNDTDPDGNPISIVSVQGATHGTVELVGGNVVFTPDANYNGSATFTYTVSDGLGGLSTATVTVGIKAVNDAPVAVADSAITNEDTPVTINVLANDTDVDGDILTVTGATASNGTVVVNADNTLSFTPVSNYSGTALIQYSISDGKGGTSSAQVTVSVTPQADAPLLQAAVSATQIGMTPLFLSNFDATPILSANETFYTSADGWVPGTGATRIEVRDSSHNSTEEQGYSGTRYIELNSATEYANTPSISRTVSTDSGSFYTLSFQYTPRPGFGADINIFEVLVDGTVVGTFAENGTGLSMTSWREGSVNFIGTGSAQTIELREASNNDQASGRGMFIDDIALAVASQYSYDITVDARLTDTDGSETLQIIIDGVPSGSILQNNSGALVANSSGQYVLDNSQLMGLKLVSGQDLHNVHLNIQAISTEGANGDSASRSTQLTINSVEASDNFAQAVVSLRTTETTALNNLTVSDSRGGNATTGFREFTVSGGSATLAFDKAFNADNDDTFEYRLQQWNGSSWSTPGYQTLNATTGPISGLVDGATYRLQIRVLDDSRNSSNASVTLSNIVLTTTLTNPEAETSAISGNVITDSNSYMNSVNSWGAVDVLGAEGAVITAVSVNGTSSTITAMGNTQVAGQYGMLSIAADGSYTYTPTANVGNLGQTDTFSYTLTQPDGDTASANLLITIADAPYSAPNLITGTGTLNGTAGDDVLIGSHEDDLILGGMGNDRLEGGAGHDTLIGGSGNDILLGGSGADTFVWQAGDFGNDVIKDFNIGEGDRIDLSDLLQGEEAENAPDITQYLRVDTATSTLLISSTGVLDATGSNADVTIKLENGADPINLNPGNLSQAALVNSLIAGSDPTIKIDHT
ncbi:tandem-95 repeat protein, partial [Pseudomonas sp.]|uniref:tandem-95 repeat protein n=1 Tax=Pseudomonas sp. TaxID=306 RepID=UPI00272FFAE4